MNQIEQWCGCAARSSDLNGGDFPQVGVTSLRFTSPKRCKTDTNVMTTAGK